MWHKTPFISLFQVLAKGLTECVTPDMLTAFLHQAGKASVRKLVYGLQPDLALCVFEDVPDLLNLEAVCASKPLADTMIVIQPVPLSTQIQVTYKRLNTRYRWPTRDLFNASYRLTTRDIFNARYR